MEEEYALEEIANDILREMYAEAEPPLDFDEVRRNPEDYNDHAWYSQHYLPHERQKEIRDKHCEKYDLSDRERSAVTYTTILNLGPRGTPSDE